MDEINKKINEIDKKLDNLTEKMCILLEKNDDVLYDCKKMNVHIDFVNNIYDEIQYPFWHIINNTSKYLTHDYNDNDDTNKLT
jgi:hypothetical protein